MKKNIITAAFAAASALLLVSSCAKEQVNENINTGDGKTFTASIEEGLKTTITGEYKVNWEQGDQIDIKGAIYSATPDASDATRATFTKVSGTDPTPEYTAVYPASIFNNGRYELPATQTYAAGKFNAPMCAISETESLEFKNFCGVLCFALKGTDKVKSIAVTANEQLCGSFEFADATSISFNGEVEGYTVTLDCGEGVQLSATDSTNFYISLPPATYTSGMKIAVTNTEGKTFKKTTTKSAAIARNKIYTFNWTATFAPEGFVDLGLKDANGKPLYWAEKNLGASKAEDYGDYFAWGETAPYYEGTGGWPTTLTWKSGKDGGYAWQSYCASSSFVEWNTPPYDATSNILKPDYDAATAANSSWRMPTKEDFTELAKQCFLEWTENYNSTGVKGMIVWKAKEGDAGWHKLKTSGKGRKIKDDGSGYNNPETHTFSNTYTIGTDPCVFFPATGNVYKNSLTTAGTYGYCWSSSHHASYIDNAYSLSFTTTSANHQDFKPRFYGLPVRPVTE